MRLILLLAAALPVTLTASTLGNYSSQSSHLAEPETLIPVISETADFWLPAYDQTNGGFFSEVDMQGNPENTNKAVVIQSRNAYGMIKAFQVTGDDSYLDLAEGALQFMYDHGWNEAQGGGWWGMLRGNGAVETASWANWTNNDVWSFWNHYQLLGIGHMVEVTDGALHRQWLETGNTWNDTYMWDSRAGFEGYYNTVAWGPGAGSSKGFTPTVDAVTTNALQNVLVSRDAFRVERLTALGDNILDYLVASMDDPRIVGGHAPGWSTDWELNINDDSSSIGHMIKTGWCLARAFLINPQERFRAGAERILDDIWTYEDSQGDEAIHKASGAPRGSINLITGDVSGDGDWWTVEQAFTGPIMTWYISRKPEYLEMADGALNFFMNNYLDTVNGEVYSVVDRNGRVRNNNKGDTFKGAYHSIELYYLAYLYGNLYLHNQPVELYYKFEAQDTERAVSLWPLAFEDHKLVIKTVEKDGVTYTDFDPDTRTINIPADETGIYKVTFANRYPFNVPPGHGDDWYEDWMGRVWFSETFFPWIYKPGLGWTYIFGYEKDGSWLYTTDESLGYVYTAPDIWPWVYSTELMDWEYLWVDLEVEPTE